MTSSNFDKSNFYLLLESESSKMVRCGQLTSKECLRFIFTKMDRVPRVYNDAVLAKLDVLADELGRFSTAGPVAFWSSVVHNKSCQKVEIQ